MSQVLAAVSPLVGLEDGMIPSVHMTKNVPVLSHKDFLSIKKGQPAL